MDCPSVMTELGAYLDGEVGPVVRAQVRSHFRGCRRCRLALHRLEATRDQFKALVADLPSAKAPRVLTLESVYRRLEPEREPSEAAASAVADHLVGMRRERAPEDLSEMVRRKLRIESGRRPVRRLGRRLIRVGWVRLAVAALIIVALSSALWPRLGAALWSTVFPDSAPGGDLSRTVARSPEVPTRTHGDRESGSRRRVVVKVRTYDVAAGDRLPSSPLLRQALLAANPDLVRRLVTDGGGR